MEFRTEIEPLRDRQGLIDHHRPVVLVGSCFSDNMGIQMTDEGFDCCVNPFGPVYNPESVRDSVRSIACRATVSPDDLVEREGRWHSFRFHSRYSRPDRADAAAVMNDSLLRARESLSRASALILTFGSSRVFRKTDASDRSFTVANCHKFPASEFAEAVLDYEQCVRCMDDAVMTARSMNPDVHVILTVSPLRYLGKGAHDNALSKSRLLLAADSVASRHERVDYFPAFEIMMDDLRDYRFYADDMKHPSSQAVRYIYEKFSESYFTEQTRAEASRRLKETLRGRHRQIVV